MYTFESRVRYSETDETGALSLTGIMNYFQDCSTFQSEDLGLGVHVLEAHGRAWWLASWNIVIDRYPVLGEGICISTWPYGFKGIYGYRNFTIRDGKGEIAVRADSVWFFFDTEKRVPARVRPEDVRAYGAGGQKPLEMEAAGRKIILPDSAVPRETFTVMRQQIDTNHHVNNAQYVEMARNLLPGGRRIAGVRVEYKRAARLGDVVCPWVHEGPDGHIISLCSRGKEPYANVWIQYGADGGKDD